MEVTQISTGTDGSSRSQQRVFSFLPNYSQGWMNAKPFKVGDQAWPGGALVEIPALETLEMEGKLDEIDRGRIKRSRKCWYGSMRFRRLHFPPSSSQISPMTVMGWEWPPTRTFRGFAKLAKVDEPLRPGMNGRMDVVIDRIPRRDHRSLKGRFRARLARRLCRWRRRDVPLVEIEVMARNPDEVAVKGICRVTQVALLEPEKKGTS